MSSEKVDIYLQNLPAEKAETLNVLRLIFEEVPGISETFDYRMPTYVLDNQIIFALAAQKNYYALYLMHYDLLENYSAELAPYDCGKSCIRFKKNSPETEALLRKIVRETAKATNKSRFFGKFPAKN